MNENHVPASRRGRRTVIALSALGLVVVVAAVVGSNPRRLWLTWQRWQARKACLQPDFDSDCPSGSWRALLDATPESFPQLAALLRDPDPRVWWHSTFAIDVALPQEEFLGWARSHDPAAALAHLLHEPWCDGTLWRNGAGAGGEWDPLRYGYWSGRDGEALEPSESAVRFLEGIIAEEADAPLRTATWAIGISPLKSRAVWALAAMLRPGETDRPGSDVTRRIRAAIERVARMDPDPKVRLEAIGSLLQRSSASNGVGAPPWGFNPPSLEEWDGLRCEVRHATRDAGDQATDSATPSARRDGDFLEPVYIRALLFLDHPRTLEIVDALRRRPEFRYAIDAEMARAEPLGTLPLPRWEPVIAAVRRHLRADPGSRALAALFVAREGLEPAVPDLVEALERETRQDLKVLERACLVALGEGSYRDAVLAELRSLVSRARAALESGFPSDPRDPRDWEPSVEALARALLLSGDPEILEIVARNYDLSGVYLEDFVEGLPGEIREPERCSRGDAIRFIDAEEGERRESAVRDWWEAHGAAVRWDPARRVFIAPLQ